MTGADNERRATFREVLAIREFRALFLAQALSVIGDQLARIAVAVLVFSRTGSSALTGVSYAVSYLPWLIGGPTLSVLADRLPRRTVMIACDCGRTLLICLVAIPGCPTWCLILLVAIAALLQPPFTAARAALIPEIVGEDDRYTAAATLTNSTLQLAVLAGFSIGGALTEAFGTNRTLLLDALTFAVSAAVIWRYVDQRPAASGRTLSRRHALSAGWRAVFGDERLRWLVTTSWILVGTVIATEAVAVPYARAHGSGSVTAGLLSASAPLGTAVGALILGRGISQEIAERAMPVLAPLAPLTLALTIANPAPLIVAVDWVVAGAFSAVTVTANRLFVVSVAHDVRGRAFGVAAAGIAGAQGIGTLAVGLAASHVSAAHAVGVVCITSLVLLPLTSARLRKLRPIGATHPQFELR